eukprot:snap_masked-scaffold_5-processed-gene-16.35-mRNA-1 protein AED:1.00 eAED:1.00 QI:0/0/0/0/1/1/2/0/71
MNNVQRNKLPPTLTDPSEFRSWKKLTQGLAVGTRRKGTEEVTKNNQRKGSSWACRFTPLPHRSVSIVRSTI